MSLIVLLEKSLESPYAVQSKYFIYSIAVSIDSNYSRGTPKAWKTIDEIVCSMLSYQFAASIEFSDAEVLACRTMSYMVTFAR